MKKENRLHYSLILCATLLLPHLSSAQQEADELLNIILITTNLRRESAHPTLYANALQELQQHVNQEQSEAGQLLFPLAVSFDTIHWAATNNLAAVIRLLVRAGVDVHSPDFVLFSTPLHHAAQHGSLQAVITLLSHGAHLEGKNRRGKTPLHLAAIKGSRSVTQELLNRGAHPNVRDRGQNTPLHFAAYEGHLDVAQELASRGANINDQNYHRSTPLHAAARNGNADLAQELLNRGADVDACNFLQNTPLHFAAEAGNKNMVTFLLEHGAQIQHNQKGLTPLSIVLMKYVTSPSLTRKETIKYLVFFGAPRSSKDREMLDALFPYEWQVWQLKKSTIIETLKPHIGIEALEEFAILFAMPPYVEHKRAAEQVLPTTGQKKQRTA